MTLKVLVIEDEKSKEKLIIESLLKVEAVDPKMVDSVPDAYAARQKLATTAYDLVVLDIVIPNRRGQAPDALHGIHLLEALDERGNLKMPVHIVGITAYPDAATAAVERFSSRLLTLIEFDPLSDDWGRRLRALVRQIIAAKRDTAASMGEYGSALGIVCALPVPELRSVLNNGWTWEQVHIEHDPAIYWRAEFPRSGEKLVAYATSSAQIGMAASAVAAMNLMRAFRPSILAMVGVAAGVRGVVNIGDIIVADPSWDWGSGKLVQTGTGPMFLAAPRQLALSPSLRTRAQLMGSDAETLAGIRASWPGEPPPTALEMHVGPLASGASVVADGGTVGLIQQQHRKLLGLEMEGYGIFCAAESFVGPRPQSLVMKSVVDFADSEKNDQFQNYGAFVSAQALRVFVERFSS